MKKPATTLALFLILISGSSAQKIVQFKTAYKPEKNYTIDTKQVVSLSMVSEIPEMVEMMKAQGLSDPITTNTVSFLQTGKPDKSTGKYPLTIKLIKSESSKGEAAMPVGTIIYGHATENDMPVLDSIAGVGDELKETMFTTIKTMFDQFNLPDTSLKVGDSVSVDNDFQSPMPGVDFAMVMTTVYKLVNISNNIAEITTTQLVKNRHDASSASIKISGSGNGKMLHDIVNNVTLNCKLDFVTHMKMPDGNAELVLKLSTDQSTAMGTTK